MEIENTPSVPDAELQLTPEEQAIADKVSGKETPPEDDGEPVDLPSDKKPEGEGDETKYAGKYDSIEDLRKGIGELNSTLPDYVLEGMSEEALERHYKELESNFHQDNNGRKHAEKKEGEQKPEGEGEGKPEAVSAELWTDLTKTFEETGTITNEQYDALNKAGIPDEVIDNYIDGVQSKQAQFTQDIFNIAGGEEQYYTIKEWAEQNIPSEQIEAISKMDKNGMIMAMKGIKAEYDAANPVDTSKRILGDTRTTGYGSYASQTEYILDVQDKRYGSDKKYTHAVDEKFKNSKNLH